MEELLWFVAGSVAGATLTKWGREVLMGIASTTIVAFDAVAAGANRAAEVVSARTAEQRKHLEDFFAEARSKARQPKTAASPTAQA
jgi:hypothetical protein